MKAFCSRCRRRLARLDLERFVPRLLAEAARRANAPAEVVELGRRRR